MSDEELKKIQEDISLIVGGDFTPDSIGPERYDATIERVRSRAREYANAVESVFMGPNFDAQMQSHIYLPALLRMIADIEPERVKKTAEKLLKQFNDLMVIYDQAKDKEGLRALLPDETINLMQRLEQRRMQLRALLK